MVDFQRFWDDVTRDYYLRFAENPASQLLAYMKLEPYARRVAVSAWDPQSQEMDFSTLGTAFLRNNLSTEFLVLHDEWDTIVPVEHTLDLIGALAGAPAPAAAASRAFVVPRAAPIDYATFTVDHFPVKSPASFDDWGAMQFAYSYLIARLAAPAAPYWVNLYDGRELAALLLHLKSVKSLGRDIRSVVPRLVDLCREKSWLYNISSPSDGVLPGPVIVSAYVNSVFGLRTTPENVRTTLENSGL
jgi:hypothetical protein